MHRLHREVGLLIIISLLTLPACSDPPPREARKIEDDTVFSEAEKAAARSLSIGDSATLKTVNDPTDRALACSQSIAVLAKSLRESDALTDKQFDALEQARLLYDRQVPIDYGTQPTADKSDASTDTVSEADDDQSQGARFALACLRNLQDQQ